ncbi:Spy/CpxP family protein refolding chaperone [Mastigocladopsis repens]|uniref:Spy/CpxP family protein refolding chaperone n=1 Tax=Mastigocladopsis repens TaxID=221287 RepID=UPI0002EF5E29|nr:Spy/CpxP family protein refolding chaperone [Mastigocladopsis repens]
MMLRRTAVFTALFFCLGSTVAWGVPSRLFKELIAQVSNEQLGFEPGQGTLIQALNLTPEQKKQLDYTFNQNKERIQQSQQELQQTAFELHSLMEGTGTSEQIRQKHSQLQHLQEQLENSHFENMLAMRAVLTPEQRRKLTEVVQKQRINLHNQPAENLEDFNLLQLF